VDDLEFYDVGRSVSGWWNFGGIKSVRRMVSTRFNSTSRPAINSGRTASTASGQRNPNFTMVVPSRPNFGGGPGNSPAVEDGNAESDDDGATPMPASEAPASKSAQASSNPRTRRIALLLGVLGTILVTAGIVLAVILLGDNGDDLDVGDDVDDDADNGPALQIKKVQFINVTRVGLGFSSGFVTTTFHNPNNFEVELTEAQGGIQPESVDRNLVDMPRKNRDTILIPAKSNVEVNFSITAFALPVVSLEAILNSFRDCDVQITAIHLWEWEAGEDNIAGGVAAFRNAPCAGGVIVPAPAPES